MIHGRSDINDERGYTSYLDMYGVVRLPTVVLFRNGHPQMYPHDEELELSQSLESLDPKELAGAKAGAPGGEGVELNKPYDEAVDLSDDSEGSVESLDTNEDRPSPKGPAPGPSLAEAKGGGERAAACKSN